MQTLDYVLGLHNCLEFSQPFSYLDGGYVNTEKVFYCLIIIISTSEQISEDTKIKKKTLNNLKESVNRAREEFYQEYNQYRKAQLLPNFGGEKSN